MGLKDVKNAEEIVMTTARALELLKIERKCVMRNHDHTCNRNCAKCDLVQDDTELIAMYNAVINIVEYELQTEKYDDIVNAGREIQKKYKCNTFVSDCDNCAMKSACEAVEYEDSMNCH